MTVPAIKTTAALDSDAEREHIKVRLRDVLATVSELLRDLGAEADDHLITIQAASDQAGISEESVRGWVRRHGIGFFDRRSNRYLVYRSRLKAYLFKRRAGVLPYGLRE